MLAVQSVTDTRRKGACSSATQSGVYVSTRQLSSVLNKARGELGWVSNLPCPLLTKMVFSGTF